MRAARIPACATLVTCALVGAGIYIAGGLSESPRRDMTLALMPDQSPTGGCTSIDGSTAWTSNEENCKGQGGIFSPATLSRSFVGGPRFTCDAEHPCSGTTIGIYHTCAKVGVGVVDVPQEQCEREGGTWIITEGATATIHSGFYTFEPKDDATVAELTTALKFVLHEAPCFDTQKGWCSTELKDEIDRMPPEAKRHFVHHDRRPGPA